MNTSEVSDWVLVTIIPRREPDEDHGSIDSRMQSRFSIQVSRYPHFSIQNLDKLCLQIEIVNQSFTTDILSESLHKFV